MPLIPSILAFDLVSPTMLAWLAGGVAPLVIHIWMRRRYREMSWAAMEYLLAAIKQSHRRMRFEQLLLLIVRTLLIVLVVLAVAEPFFEEAGTPFSPGERTHHVMVMDGSFSMAFKSTDKTRFERAKELARRIVEESPRGDGFTLVLMADPPQVVVGNPVFEARDFLPEVENLKLLHTSADLPATLIEVERILTRARSEHSRLVREEVQFFTDLDRACWAIDPARVEERTQCHQRLLRLAESASLVIVDLGQAGAENLGVIDARTSEPFATLASGLDIEADLKDFGRQGKKRQAVELIVDGRRVNQMYVDVPPGGEASVSFFHRFESPGDHEVEIRAAGDNLDVDNHRFLAVPVKRSIGVLCVDGRPSGEPFGAATDFLAVALAPENSLSEPGRIQPEVVPESALSEYDLDRYDCVFLANVAQFTSSEARVLDSYLAGGGSLVFFLGDRVQADRYNRELGGGRAGGVNLLPARLGQIVDRTQNRLDPLGYGHPIVRSFRGNERAGLLRAPVRSYFQLTLPEGAAGKVVLALEDGSPLIVEGLVHRGRVVLVATSADVSWTDMPILAGYVPIVQEILSFAVRGRFQDRNLAVGDALGESLPAHTPDVPLTLQTPDGQNRPLSIGSDPTQASWSYSDTYISGNYTAELGPPISRRHVFAVNVDPVESELAKISPEELQVDEWPGVPFFHQAGPRQAANQPVTGVPRRSQLPKWLLYMAMATLFLETYLARRFGYYSR
jgi:aerotolerance regulator-like protein/VWA domain-containing protein